ncbi:TPA: IS110 family transposase [Salmonella enterica subsp. enterica serovar Hvittingfoss]|nr:IS110 family transposase [Salmonella enterica subsp. enterica serovar Hvittingfoss]
MQSVNFLAYVGLDVHKETLAVAIASPERLGEVRYYGTISNEPQAVRRLFQKLLGMYGCILACYEAGPCGFGLYHLLTTMNVECQVIAPSHIPKSPTDHIKNDHRDAVSLARLLRAGELTSVWIPDIIHESMRDLIRARAASKRDSRVARQRIQSMLLRTDKRYTGKPWTGKHRTWLANQSFPQRSQQIAFQHYCQSLEQIEDRILQLDQEITRLLPDWSLCNLVCQLQALKGVGQLIAITLVAELGDFSRLSNPRQIMAFLGLVPGEHSSGGSIRPRGITKVGNSELRRLLYEAAWSYRTPAKVGAWLMYYRPDSVTQRSKDIAWKAQQRLCFRYRSLIAKGKKSQIAITAVARELTGFMWDIAFSAQLSPTQSSQS